MICANCDHPGRDHIDSCFGGRYCAPPANATGWTTVRCLCPGFRPMSAFEVEMAVLRQTRPWARFVRESFAAAFPDLDMAGLGVAV